LDAARATLEAHGDRVNATYARCLEARRLLLLGRLDEAERQLGKPDPASFPPAMTAIHELIMAGIHMRRLKASASRAAFDGARHAAQKAGIPALMAEVDGACRELNAPAARLVRSGVERIVRPD